MSVRNTQVGQEVQLNSVGNSINGNGQGTTVQLGALNNSSPAYRDPRNPCQGYQQTNYMGSFRDRNLIYLSGVIGGPTIGLTGQYFSLFSSGAGVVSTTYMQGAGGAQGYIIGGSYFFGTGGDGGAGGSVGQGGFPGGTGRAGIEFQGGAYGVLQVQSAPVYGGGGGGGGGGSSYSLVDYPYQTTIGLGGGGGGGGRGGGGAFGSGGPGGYGDYASGQAGGAGPGGGGGSYSYYFSAGGGGQGGYSTAGQPGAGGTYGGGGGGGQGTGVSGFPGNDYIQWVNSPHN